MGDEKRVQPETDASGDQAAQSDLMTTKEVAAYLRLKERRIYELLKQKDIPATRVTGKWLFPRALIDLWLAENLEGQQPTTTSPPVIAGSQDPLLEWAVRESSCGLALLPGGSLDGLKHFSAGQARVAGLHIYEPAEEDGVQAREFNRATVAATFPGQPLVLMEWARRRQGLVVAQGNPLKLGSLDDVKQARARVVQRQKAAGSQLLLAHLLGKAGLQLSNLETLPNPARTEMDLGLAVLEGRADAGLAVEAVARSLKLDFVPLFEERYDLLIRRRDYFEEPFQRLLTFAQSSIFNERVEALQGYDVSHLGRIHYNGP
ncbi:substrate-binding domain-containing protein [Rhodovibrionaceae bacterium A322]